ncbi:MAG: hypothetical protein J6M54_01910 [Prevotella sp.]|nr:hypothetical protein [Prevotella sp.]
MRRIILFAFFAIATISAVAQAIVRDKTDSQPVPYASVFSQDGDFLGNTSLTGEMPDVGSAESVRITHVAYVARKVDVKDLSGDVFLEPSEYQLGEVVYQKPKSHCICLTGYVRNYEMNRLTKDKFDVGPQESFYDGIMRVYLFLGTDKKAETQVLVARNLKTGEMKVKNMQSIGPFAGLLTNYSYIEGMRKSDVYSLRETDEGKTVISRKGADVGLIADDANDSIIHFALDFVSPDDEKNMKVLFINYRIKEQTANAVYRKTDNNYVSQTDLMALNARMAVMTNLFGDALLMDDFREFYVGKAEYLTKEEYKASVRECKDMRKSGRPMMTSEQLNDYIVAHNIPAVSEEIVTKMALVKQLQDDIRHRAEAKRASKKKNKNN